jgi:hypothetical protein
MKELRAMPEKYEQPKRQPGRPPQGSVAKKQMTMRFLPEVYQHLKSLAKPTEAIETAIKATDAYKAWETKKAKPVRQAKKPD